MIFPWFSHGFPAALLPPWQATGHGAGGRLRAPAGAAGRGGAEGAGRADAGGWFGLGHAFFGMDMDGFVDG